ncbi:S1 family peptidase [Tsukamurella tyrosinosolvens]|uniref:S1 family peptidase n=1 Tax=Tsukamurella tyrosinosolvens TaxID=57704 RepID=UPI001E3163D6|nr:S1 family peptidase [Tsukamurella tyrosinosolvens]
MSWPVLRRGTSLGYLTAGHCNQQQGAPLWIPATPFGTPRVRLAPLQDSARGLDERGASQDSAVFYLSRAAREAGASDLAPAPGVVLRGVLTPAQVMAMPKGTSVCMNGARSGVTCGPLIAADEKTLEWGGGAVSGDSGAPVFVVDRDGDAMAIGMLTGGPTDTDNFATYLAPALERLGVSAVVGPDSKR